MFLAFRFGTDLHIQTAAVLLGKNPADVSGPDRQLAKAVNFGLLYGQGVKGLVIYHQMAYGIKLTEEEAAYIRKRFFNHYKGLAAWHKANSSQHCAHSDKILERRSIRVNPDSILENYSRACAKPARHFRAESKRPEPVCRRVGLFCCLGMCFVLEGWR